MKLRVFWTLLMQFADWLILGACCLSLALSIISINVTAQMWVLLKSQKRINQTLLELNTGLSNRLDFAEKQAGVFQRPPPTVQ